MVVQVRVCRNIQVHIGMSDYQGPSFPLPRDPTVTQYNLQLRIFKSNRFNKHRVAKTGVRVWITPLMAGMRPNRNIQFQCGAAADRQ